MNIEKKLYQWDTEQKLTGCTGLYVDFPIGNEVYRVETADGTCIIPDELLQTSGSHKVYECMTNNTIRSFAFSVTPRPKPPDYVYTPTERLTFEGLVRRVDDAVADMIRRAESGEFDGHTPVKGTDYFTTGEIQQIQNEVSSGAIGEFKSVVDTETETFNTNAESKLITYNENDVAKTGAYNTNASNKVTEYNSNAENKTAEFDTHTEQIQADISELKSDLNDIACVKYSTHNRQSEMFTLYVSNGYINNDTGQFVENELFRCYTFTNNINAKVWFDTQQTWGQIAIYNGDIFVQSNLIFIGSLSRDTLPYIDNKLVIQSGMNVVICIRNDVDFTLNYPDGYYINEKQTSLIANELLKPKIKIIPVTDTEFKVAVLNEKTGTYLYHIFKYEYYKDTVVGSAVWYSTFIQDEVGNNIMQGNTNFIHYLNEEGHTGHVGASHGCCVAVFDEFWADGKRFEPSALNEIIYCDTFRFTEKVKHYLIDTSNTTASTHAMPYLDENGNPIVESIEYLDGCWEVNNKIVIRNRLDIKRNNTTFLQCHAGMCCGFYPYFDNIVVNNKEYVWNKIESSDGINFTIANMSGSDRLFNLGGSSAVTGDEVILFGEKYRVKNRIIQNDGTRYKNSNMLIQMPPYADNRIKTYLMPCICSQSLESVSSGQTVETFNDGDILDTTIIREIDVSN